MEQLHEPFLKQCIASLAMNNNILKQNPCDSFCLLKNDANSNQQAAKTVSLVLTRLTNATGSYVHVLRCNVCDYLTLNPSTLKEHFRLRHPSSLGFLTYTCPHCSSMSTERCLMEEHLRMYHRMTENPGTKLLERFHTPTSDVLSLNCVSPSTVSGNTLPFTLMNSNTATTQNNLAINLANAITAFQNVNKHQAQQTVVSAGSSASTTCTVSNVSTTKATVTAPTSVNLGNPEQDVNTDSQVFQDGSVSSETLTSNSNNSAVSGSRRRKATTPGRICLSVSKTSNEGSSSEDTDMSSRETNQPMISSVKVESSVYGASPSGKRTLSGLDEVDGQIKDGITSPKSKRLCRDSDNKVIDANTAKNVAVSKVTPLCLSIGNSITDSKQMPVVTFSSANVNGLNSVASPFLGQLIPLSSLPENVICSLSTALMHNPIKNSTNNITTINTEHHNEPSTANNAPSAWLLTNPSGNLSCNLTQQTALNTLQPTLFVPVPALGDSPATSAIKVPQSSDNSVASNASSNCTGILRYPDIIEALKYMAANGSLISSINVPTSTYSTNLSMQVNNTINASDNSGRTQPASQIHPSNLSTSDSLAALVAHLTAANNPQVVSQTIGTHVPIRTSSATSTDNNLVDTLSFCPSSSSDVTNMSNFTALVSPAPVHTKFDGRCSDGTTSVSGSTPINNIETNGDVSFTSNDQALDMSVRSTTMSSEHTVIGASNLLKSGTDVNASSCKEESTLEQSTLNVVNNVADVINAALKGGLKQRLIQSIEVPVSSLFPNPAHCLSALASTIYGLPTVNETLIGSDNPDDKGNQNVNCQNECYNNATTNKKQIINCSMANSLQSSEVDNKLTDSGNKSPQTSIAGSTTANSPSTSSHIVSLAQLQAIMAVLANTSSVSISVPFTSTATTSSFSLMPTCTTTMSSLNSSNLSFQQLINPTTASVSSPGTSVFINSPTAGSNLNISGSVSASETGNTSLISGLNNLTNVCGFTLTGASSLMNNTTYNPTVSNNLNAVSSNIKGITVPQGISLTGILSGNVNSISTNSGHLGHTVMGNPALINFISASKSPVQSGVTLSSANAARLLSSLATSTTGANLLPVANSGTVGANTSMCGNTLLGTASLPSGSISLLDPQQTLFAAAAAAAQNIQKPGAINNAVNQIALASLKASSGCGKNIGPTAPVIGLLDPRTGLQLRVADASSAASTILTSANLSNCLNNTSYSNPPDSDQNETRLNETSRGITNDSDLNQTSELETGSNYDDQIDEEWEPEQDETCSVQGSAQHLFSNRNDRSGDKTTGESGFPNKNDQSGGENIYKNDISSNSLLTSGNKRSLGSTRTSGANSSNSRRGLASLNDANNQHLLRPHRQNFTPTQNRILTEWYQLHQAKPYPSTDDTKELANISGLSYSQVKKWFANKRARSTSSGLPKPTPPLAPDSSTDPSAAAAIVAAAVAAATSAVADVGQIMTSTPTTSGNTSSNVVAITSNIIDSDVSSSSSSIQPFPIKPKSVSFTSQSYTDLGALKIEKDKETEFVSGLISSHLQINQEDIKTVLLLSSSSQSNNNKSVNSDNLVHFSNINDKDEQVKNTLDDGDDDSNTNTNNRMELSDDSHTNKSNPVIMMNSSLNLSDPISYSASSPPTLHVHINHKLNSPPNRLDTLSSPSSSSSSSTTASLSDEECHKQHKTISKEKIKEDTKNKSSTCNSDSALIIAEETNSDISNCFTPETEKISSPTDKDCNDENTSAVTIDLQNDKKIIKNGPVTLETS
ncbi:unnamed protein product [Trichobilharzia szidati]|nr:unnamed protein product [Trichobilharzia szidati]